MSRVIDISALPDDRWLVFRLEDPLAGVDCDTVYYEASVEDMVVRVAELAGASLNSVALAAYRRAKKDGNHDQST